MNLKFSKTVEKAPACAAHWFCDGHLLVHWRRNRRLAEAYNRAVTVHVDGTATQILAWLVSWKWVSRWTGSDCLARGLAGSLDGEVGIVGGSKRMHERLRRQSSVQLITYEPGYHRKWTKTMVRTCLKELSSRSPNGQLPRHIFVALGAPKQELWIDVALAMTRGSHQFYGVGAALDYAAGAKRRAPRWLCALHMEWCFRICQEPGRLIRRYLWVGCHLLPLYLRALGQREQIRHQLRKHS